MENKGYKCWVKREKSAESKIKRILKHLLPFANIVYCNSKTQTDYLTRKAGLNIKFLKFGMATKSVSFLLNIKNLVVWKIFVLLEE